MSSSGETREGEGGEGEDAPWLLVSLPTRPSRMSRTRLPNATSGRFQFQQFFHAVSSMAAPPETRLSDGMRLATASAFWRRERWFSLQDESMRRQKSLTSAKSEREEEREERETHSTTPST